MSSITVPQLRNACGVQQGDPLGPFFFSLALNHIVQKIQNQIPGLLLHMWYLDDGVFCGNRDDIHKVLRLLDIHSSPIGLSVNLKKCELFSKGDLSMFSPIIPRSNKPNIIILGVPIGDQCFTSTFIASRREKAEVLLQKLPRLEDPQAALMLLRSCSGFYKLANIARGTPPSLASTCLKEFDNDICQALEEIAGIQLSDTSWSQARLSFNFGGLGLRSLSDHSAASFTASYVSATQEPSQHLCEAVNEFNSNVQSDNHLNVSSVFHQKPKQYVLSQAVDKSKFNELYHCLPPAH